MFRVFLMVIVCSYSLSSLAMTPGQKQVKKLCEDGLCVIHLNIVKNPKPKTWIAMGLLTAGNSEVGIWKFAAKNWGKPLSEVCRSCVDKVEKSSYSSEVEQKKLIDWTSPKAKIPVYFVPMIEHKGKRYVVVEFESPLHPHNYLEPTLIDYEEGDAHKLLKTPVVVLEDGELSLQIRLYHQW